MESCQLAIYIADDCDTIAIALFARIVVGSVVLPATNPKRQASLHANGTVR